ncbi:MAG TPA: phosphate regulon sensor protein PhoR, partial [Ramlibacter sp.]
MALRIVLFLACLAGGAVLGAMVGGPVALALGVAAGALFWLLTDAVDAARVLGWLRAGELRDGPHAGGPWGEVVDRVR